MHTVWYVTCHPLSAGDMVTSQVVADSRIDGAVVVHTTTLTVQL